MPKFLQGISLTQVFAAMVTLCLFLAADGITLGHVGNVSGVVFLGGLALTAGGLAAKPWYVHSTVDQVAKSTQSVVEGGPATAPAPDAAHAAVLLPVLTRKK